MRKIGHTLFTHKKIIIIFICAIFIPSVILIYLSYNTFIQRRETVKNLLKSNLWISGNAALDALENEIKQIEKKVLDADTLVSLIKEDQYLAKESFELLNLNSGWIFLLDSNFNLIQPGIPEKDPVQAFRKIYNSKSPFGVIYRQAESFEFSQKNYVQAIKLYDRCLQITSLKDLHANALEGQGRCFFALQKFDKAENIYKELGENYAHSLNSTGHPFGIVAGLQLYEIRIARNQKGEASKDLLLLYEKIRGGNWRLTAPVFDFFKFEIESILEKNIYQDNSFELKRSYENLKNKTFAFEENLRRAEFIRNEGTSQIKNVSLTNNNQNSEPHRFILSTKNNLHFISYRLINDLITNHHYYAVFYWNMPYLKKETIPGVLSELEKETGLRFQLIDETNQNISGNDKILHTDVVFNLSYRPISLPWKLFVFHPEMGNVERTAQQEILIYGILLVVIITLMIFGAFLIIRDIYRESETTRLKTEFVHNISHELKTPLTLIRLYGETLQRKKNLSEKDRKKSHEIITKESERLSHLIDNVLDFSRIEMGQKEFNLKNGNVTHMIRNTLKSYRYHLDKKGFKVITEISNGIPDTEFDEEALSSVLINLLSNAMKFSPSTKEISVKLFCDDKNVILEVADMGVGITPKEVSRIFDRFYRAENKYVSKTRGSGLGLTLVKHIVDAHHGRISVRSEPGEGSVFTVFLPIDSSDQRDS